MDYVALAQALNLDAQKEAARNPWNMGQQMIQSVPTWNPNSSAGSNIGSMALQGFLSGITGQLGKREADRGIADRNEALRGFMAAPPEQQGSMLQDNEYLKPYSSVIQAMQADEDRQLKAKAAEQTQKDESDIQKFALQEYLKGTPGAAAQMLGIKVPKKEIATPLNGSVQDRTMQLFKQLRDQGYPEQQAATTANALLEVDRKKMGSTLKAVEAAREKAAQLESMASTAEQAIAGAGRTGPLSSDWGASVLGFLGVGDQSEKAAATTLLNSVKPSALAANKVPGMGAMSDFESKAFFAAAPGSDKLPEQNMVLVNKMKQAAQLENEHADFLETYIAERGTDRGAQQAWNQYKKSNPLIVRDPSSGEYVVNPNRRPWAEMFGGGAAQEQSAPTTGDYTPEELSYKEQYKQKLMAQRGGR